jgi:glutamyl-tRNA synthetase
MEEKKKVVTRFAPSPTGFVHIGSIRTALYAHLLARRHGGTFILRIEDTDRARVVEGSLEHIQKSLKWLNLNWDFGPDTLAPFGSCIQSERLSTYLPWAEKLIEKGLAYPDPYTADEVAAFRKKAEEEKRPFLYRDHRPKTFGTWDGKTALRYRVPEIKRYEWTDEVRGTLSAGEEALDDIVIMKADGYPVYAFAHIIDDYNMGVTHILRSDEWISSVPRFMSLYEALEITPPLQVTLPPILRDDRTKKLGKRDGAKDVLDYKDEGFLPEAIVNYLALIGWNPGTDQEMFTLDELTSSFSVDRIQKGGAAFDEEKLEWFNREHMKKLSSKEFWEKAKPWTPENLNKTMLEKIEHLIRDRVSKLSDIKTLFDAGEFTYFFNAPTIEKNMLSWKNSTPENAAENLKRVADILKTTVDWTSIDILKDTLMPLAEKEGKGNVLWPLRTALSGKEKSPDPFTLLHILGKDQSLERITVSLHKLHEK